MLKKQMINGKLVYIVEKHNVAPLAWQEYSSISVSPPALITLDYHTDTHQAFLCYTFWELNPNGTGRVDYELQCANIEKLCHEALVSKDWCKYINKLKNDEHIDFSIRTNIISHAYVISKNTTCNTIRSEEYKAWFNKKCAQLPIFNFNEQQPDDVTFIMPLNKIFELDDDHLLEFGIINCEREIAKIAIDDNNLWEYLKKINIINHSIFGKSYDVLENYILDIDLDYFRTFESLTPNECACFYTLIRNSKIITIALEPTCVDMHKLEGESLTSQVILDEILNHIYKATL